MGEQQKSSRSVGQGDDVLARHFYRVHDADVVAATAAQFPVTKLFKVEDLFSSWDAVQSTHFASGGVLDQLLAEGKR